MEEEELVYGYDECESRNDDDSGNLAGEHEVDIDEALETTGPCGRFQMSFQVLFMGLILMIGFHAVLNYFIGNDPAWTCALNSTASFCMNNMGRHFSTDNKLFSARCKMNRTDWVYTTPKSFSFVTEYDLVCEKTSIAALTSGIFYLGGFGGNNYKGLVCVADNNINAP